MATPPPPIRFQAPLQRPANPSRARWGFVVLPGEASACLPSRGMVTVECQVGAHAFQATLSPDGQGGHWLKLPAASMQAAGVAVGQVVELCIEPVAREPEPRVPPELRRALGAQPAAQAQWQAITAVARRDFIQWIETAKKPETRVRRIANACDMLASGKRRVCCFDRSGMYGKGLSAPKAAAGTRDSDRPGRT